MTSGQCQPIRPIVVAIGLGFGSPGIWHRLPPLHQPSAKPDRSSGGNPETLEIRAESQRNKIRVQGLPDFSSFQSGRPRNPDLERGCRRHSPETPRKCVAKPEGRYTLRIASLKSLGRLSKPPTPYASSETRGMRGCLPSGRLPQENGKITPPVRTSPRVHAWLHERRRHPRRPKEVE